MFDSKDLPTVTDIAKQKFYFDVDYDEIRKKDYYLYNNKNIGARDTGPSTTAITINYIKLDRYALSLMTERF